MNRITSYNVCYTKLLRHLSDEQVEQQVKKTMATVEQRNMKFRQNRPFPDITGRSVILVDDGLASGFTMRAAIAYVRKRKSYNFV